MYSTKGTNPLELAAQGAISPAEAHRRVLAAKTLIKGYKADPTAPSSGFGPKFPTQTLLNVAKGQTIGAAKEAYGNIRHPIRRLEQPNQQMMFPGMGGKFHFEPYAEAKTLAVRAAMPGKYQKQFKPGGEWAYGSLSGPVTRAFATDMITRAKNKMFKPNPSLGVRADQIALDYGTRRKPISGGSTDPFRIMGGAQGKEDVQKLLAEHLRTRQDTQPGVMPFDQLQGAKTSMEDMNHLYKDSPMTAFGVAHEVRFSTPGDQHNVLHIASDTGIWPDFGMSRNPGKGIHKPNPTPNEFPPEGWIKAGEELKRLQEEAKKLGPDHALGSRKAPREIDDMPDGVRNIIHEGGGKPPVGLQGYSMREGGQGAWTDPNADLKNRIEANKRFIAKNANFRGEPGYRKNAPVYAPKDTQIPNTYARPSWLYDAGGIGGKSGRVDPERVPTTYMRKAVDTQLGSTPMTHVSTHESGGSSNPAFYRDPRYDKGFMQGYDQRGSRQKIFRDITKNKQLSRVMFNYLYKSRN